MPTGPEKSIFLSALDCRSQPEREAYLAEACGGDPALRKAVDELLAAHNRSQNVLDEAGDSGVRLGRQLDEAADVLGLNATSAFRAGWPETAPERTGEVIGNYRLMEKIGEGGFGQVYVADQQQPVRRRVALKLLKPGMDSREVIARFEAERQALAMMDHPNIARVFDAGTTPAGQPYFVMELVRGVPMTTFCEQQQLGTRQRLKLFVDVCHAVQHAHQKGVIHRDLKPSNVLISLHDVTPVVKVIDFGVAKAISDPLTDKTLYTRFAQMIGTPLYMSPEQAELSGLDVDTRSDIYSLGVLLYELLTGTTPFDQRRLHAASFDELRRIIREEEPPRPSLRLSTLAQTITTDAATRRSDPRLRATTLRGDLDWIVMKALEKDRKRRYDTAADLARDVQRYLDQQPVVARPPSQWYRFRKFVRRNRVTFTAASLVLAALIVGTSVSTWQAVRATRARAEAEGLRQEAVEFANRLKEANVLLDSARANAHEERFSLALAQFTKATELQPEHYLTWSGRGSFYIQRGAWRVAAGDFARALKLGAPANNPGWWGVPQLCVYAGDDDAYRTVCRTLREQLEQSDDPALVSYAVRSLLIGQDSGAGDARALADRVERLLAARPHGIGPPFPGSPPFPPRPPDHEPPENRPPPGREPPGREAPWRRGFPAEFLWYAAGLAHFRAGDFEPAVQRLRQAADAGLRFPSGRVALPLLAMCYHGLGQDAEAQHALTEARQALDEWTSALSEGGLEKLPVPWLDLLECHILFCEASSRIRGSEPPDHSRLEQIEQRSLAAMRGQ